MELSRTGIAALVALCGAAGAGGSYLASRGSIEPAAAAVEVASETTPQGAATGASPVVVERAAPSPASTVAPPARAFRSRRPQTQASPNVISERSAAAPVAVEASSPDGDSEAASLSRPRPIEAVPPEPVADIPRVAPDPPFEEVVVERDVVLGLQIDNTVTSETARIEDQVVARVTRDVRVGERVAIPSGAKAYGDVIEVERGGKLRERARLAVRFSSIVLADGTRLPIATDLIVREGDSPSRESAAKIGGSAIGGAILGGILGGGKGAIIGGTAGAGAGTAIVMAGGRNEAVLAAGTPVTVRLTKPVTVEVER